MGCSRMGSTEPCKREMGLRYRSAPRGVQKNGRADSHMYYCGVSPQRKNLCEIVVREAQLRKFVR